MHEADFNNNGEINYTEFIAATLDSKVIMKQENVWAAFKRFDIVRNMQENQGFITRENLKKAMEKTGIEVKDNDILAIMEELQLKNPNQLDFQEFCIVLDCKFYIATNAFNIPPPDVQVRKIGK